jgi:hypothetical protein
VHVGVGFWKEHGVVSVFSQFACVSSKFSFQVSFVRHSYVPELDSKRNRSYTGFVARSPSGSARRLDIDFSTESSIELLYVPWLYFHIHDVLSSTAISGATTDCKIPTLLTKDPSAPYV